MTSKTTSRPPISAPIIHDHPADGKSNSIAEAAVQLLSQRTAQAGLNLSIAPEAQASALDQVFQLENPTVAPVRLGFSLDLSTQEMNLICEMFDKWSLNPNITLLDLWAFDLYRTLETIKKHLAVSDRESVIQDFCSTFLTGVISILAEKPQEDFSKLKVPFYDREHPPKERCFVITRNEWAWRLHELHQKLEQRRQTVLKLQTLATKEPVDTSEILNSLAETQKKLELGMKLLRHPHARTILFEKSLLGLVEFFPQAKHLSSSIWQKTETDLISFVSFLDFAQEAAIQKQLLGVSLPFFKMLKDKLIAFSQKTHHKMAAARRFKSEISEGFFKGNQFKGICFHDAQLAATGKETHAQYLKRKGMAFVAKKSQSEFAANSYHRYLQVHICLEFASDILLYFDESIMVPLYPEDFVPTHVSFNRLNINLGYFFDLCFNPSSDNLPSPALAVATPIELSTTQQDSLKALLKSMHENSLILLLKSFSKSDDLIRLYFMWSSLNQGDKVDYVNWIPFFKEMAPLFNLDAFETGLQELRKQHLAGMETFLATLDPEKLPVQRREWLAYFQEVSFQTSLDLCRFSMLMQDCHAFLNLHTNLNVSNSEDHLLTPGLVDLMEVEGLEAVFHALLTPSWLQDFDEDGASMSWFFEPEETAAPKKTQKAGEAAPATPPKKDKLEHKGKTPPAAPKIPGLEASVEPEPFRIRRGEKTRKILKRLRDIGMLPKRQSGTAHQVHKSEDGKRSTVVAVGGAARKHIPRGTAAAIAHQVNDKA
jgi:hypothetical protein